MEITTAEQATILLEKIRMLEYIINNIQNEINNGSCFAKIELTSGSIYPNLSTLISPENSTQLLTNALSLFQSQLLETQNALANL